LSFASSSDAAPGKLRAHARALISRVREVLAGEGDDSVTKRMAGIAFLVRVVSAALIFGMHILLARWMGRYDFGIYVYVWTWVILIGGLAPLGIAYSTQRFIPEYITRKDDGLLRGFLFGSRAISFALGVAAGLLGIALILLLGDRVGDSFRGAFLLGFSVLPIFALAGAQDGIARSYNWFDIALVPGYIAQPLLILALLTTAHFAGLKTGAVTAMAATVLAFWTTAVVQGVLLQRRLSAHVPKGPRAYEVPHWFKTALPIFMVDGFYFLLTYTDILVLELFVGPDDIATYYAATKTLALIAFIYFAVNAAFAHKFSQYHYAGEKEKLENFLTLATRWTFWPSLAAAAVMLSLGHWILMLFGEDFVEGYPLMFVLALGLLARAAVGPAERLLNMVGEQRICAIVYCSAFMTNLVLCLTLVPMIGLMGAAISTACAIVLESTLLFIVVKRRLGLHALVWHW
jgi:O-antigen/teichoic acid export membrane protein